jgi:hypothetical protein
MHGRTQTHFDCWIVVVVVGRSARVGAGALISAAGAARRGQAYKTRAPEARAHGCERRDALGAVPLCQDLLVPVISDRADGVELGRRRRRLRSTRHLLSKLIREIFTI